MDRKTFIATYMLSNNCIRMLATERKSKIVKLFLRGQTHKIILHVNTYTQNITKSMVGLSTCVYCTALLAVGVYSNDIISC